jgi:hypothetical protein
MVDGCCNVTRRVDEGTVEIEDDPPRLRHHRGSTLLQVDEKKLWDLPCAFTRDAIC